MASNSTQTESQLLTGHKALCDTAAAYLSPTYSLCSNYASFSPKHTTDVFAFALFLLIFFSSRSESHFSRVLKYKLNKVK